jgi:8-oxo-dGTP pyrophosphatase MutT (NUDIX family)
MRQRPASRLLIVDDNGRVLLFRYVHKQGPLAGQDFWSTPGGGVEDGESFEQAACRELREETGLIRDAVGEAVAERGFAMQLPDGEWVEAREKYFVVMWNDTSLSRHGWTDDEAAVIADQRWWSKDELARTSATVWPENLLDMLNADRRMG